MPRAQLSTRDDQEAARYWTRDDLGGLEFLWARFRRHAYRPHSHPGYVIAVVTNGVETVNCRGSLHRAGPGDILFVNPEATHDGQSGAEDGWQYRVFYPSLGRAAIAQDGKLCETPYFTDTVVHDPALAARLARLHAVAETARSKFCAQVEWLDLLGEVVTRYCSVQGPRMPNERESARIRRIREMIEANCDAPLSLDCLAAEVQVSPYHLIRLFKAHTGVSPHAYLIARRLRRAKVLLDRKESAAEVAAAAGFVDQSHFIRHFKAAYGFTPGQYAAARFA
jgi:AraC-like DNA-binding protein